MMSDQSKVSKRKIFDLSQRTEKFGEAILVFAQALPLTSVTRPLVEQLVRSGTSVGANYCEADDALTARDFTYKISICQREVKERKFWLKMIAKVLPDFDSKPLMDEAQELRLIFSAIIRKTKVKFTP